MDLLLLKVTPSGLREGHDPKDPKLMDIRSTYQLAALPDMVILETEEGEFEVKGRDPIDDDDTVHVVVFDGIRLRGPETMPHRPASLALSMQRALNHAKRVGRHG